MQTNSFGRSGTERKALLSLFKYYLKTFLEPSCPSKGVFLNAKERMNRQVSGMTAKTHHPIHTQVWERRGQHGHVKAFLFFFEVRLSRVAVPLSSDIHRDPEGSELRVVDALNAEADA